MGLWRGGEFHDYGQARRVSGEVLGLALLLPFGVDRAAYIVHGVLRDEELSREIGRQVDTASGGKTPLDAALVLGNPPWADAAAFERDLRALWARLRPGATLVVGAETLAGRVRHGRWGVMGSSRVRRAALGLGTPPRRTWQAYPSLSRPTVLSTRRAGADLRGLALDQAGLRDSLLSMLVSRGQRQLVAAFTVPAVLWEFRK